MIGYQAFRLGLKEFSQKLGPHKNLMKKNIWINSKSGWCDCKGRTKYYHKRNRISSC